MVEFPPVEYADDDGLLAMGGDLDIATLQAAYSQGIFPWPIRERFPVLWFAPPQRALLFFDEFHVGRRLRRELRHAGFETRVDFNFPAIIQACARARRRERGTWITKRMQNAYIRLHHAGIAHSVETYQDGELVGGLYGVAIGAYFCGESMFHTHSGASKAAFIHLVEHLQARGATWLDAQMLTPLLESFGAREVPRDEFMSLLREAQQRSVVLFEGK